MQAKISIKLLFFCAVLFISTLAKAQEKNIENYLEKMPGLSFEQSEDLAGNYTLRVQQPLDHSDASKGHFEQKVYFSHVDFEQPVVLVTDGYDSRDYPSELTRLLKANQIRVEHRFYGESKPENMDYEYLNLEQATADLHLIRNLFKPVYKGKWISTGISKSGVTSIFYKYFYPEDIDVAIPYVAPINKAFEDKRIYKFLKKVGPKECRDQLKEIQFRLLENRTESLAILKKHCEKQKATFNYMSFEKAFELAVLEYPFSFWQYYADCDILPSPDAPIEKIVQHFINIADMSFFGDYLIEYFGSHYYQAADEMGYYGYEIKPYKKLIKALPTDENPHATFLPKKEMQVAFDDALLKDVLKWLKKEGDHIIYLYGNLDTWTACAVPASKKVDSEWFFMQGKHHGNARISQMTKAEYKRFTETLEEWLEIEIK